MEGVEAGSILNVEFKDAKMVLDRAIEDAWDHGRGSALPPLPTGDEFYTPAYEDLRALHWDVKVYYVRDAIAASKKLAKTKVTHPWVAGTRAFVAKVLPLALAMEGLRGHIVKGRRPNPEAEARKAAKLNNPNAMERATCGCCFAEQAVLPNGFIHDHGYRIPREWVKTASCHGRRFRPLEVSDEGPKFMVGLLTSALANLHVVAANLRVAKTFRVQKGYRHPAEYEDIEVGHPRFEAVRESRLREAEQNIKGCRADLAEFQKVVAEWRPAAPSEGHP